MRHKPYVKRVVSVLVAVGLSVAFASSAHAAVLVRYSFSTVGNVENLSDHGDGYQPTELNPIISASPSISPFGPVNMQLSTAAPTPAGAPFLRVDTLAATDFKSALSSNALFFFGLFAKPGPAVTLTSLDFDVTRGGTDAPSGYGAFADLRNAPAVSTWADLTTSRPNYTHVSLPLAGVLGTDGPITIRFYVYAPAGSTVDFDNIVVNGTTPEPGALPLLGLGGLALFRRGRARA